jgi:DNA-binding GntR family transcriptional regulator
MQNSQSHLAYLALEHLIVTLQLKPGAFITEKQLIEQAGHGRTPVREAIQKLAWQGLMIVKPRVGLQIAEIGSSDRADVMQVRREIEPIAASLVATHANADERGRLIDISRRMSDCAVTGDMAAFFAADKAFDEILEDACPNRFITAALAPVQAHSRRIWYSTATLERMARSIALHVDVICAIHKAQKNEAHRLMVGLIDNLGA